MIIKKKKKDAKKCVIKQKIKFEDYKHCLEVTELGKEIIHQEKNKINTKQKS